MCPFSLLFRLLSIPHLLCFSFNHSTFSFKFKVFKKKIQKINSYKIKIGKNYLQNYKFNLVIKFTN